jgi:hypothetical protein
MVLKVSMLELASKCKINSLEELIGVEMEALEN